MINFFRGFLGISDKKGSTSNDFSDFFAKPSGDKVKVIREVLREANAEQRRIMEKSAYQA